MPTYDKLPRFDKDFAQLSAEDKERFRQAAAKLAEDLNRRRQPRSGLRVRGIEGTTGIFEITWAPDGRATFHYGEPVREGQPHVVWRRVGRHSILANP
jgi:hypothetical protein